MEIRRVLIIKIFVITCVLLYFFGYEFGWNKKYQKRCHLHSSVRPKVSGVTKLGPFTDAELAVPNPEAYRDIRFRDSVDLVEHLGERQVFVTTNYILTSNQTVGNCSESPAVNGAICKEDKDCPKNKQLTAYGYGITTGKCIPCSAISGSKTCEVTAWCPTENWKLPFKEERPMFDVRDFIIMPKVFVSVPECDGTLRGRNMRPEDNNKYIQNCVYHPIDSPNCPNLRISDVLKGAGYEYENVSLTGAIFEIKLDWGSASLDFGYNLRHYMPKYYFSRVDTTRSSGFNFKSAIYNYEGLSNRTHIHRFGLTFEIIVEGEARKFDSFGTLQSVVSIYPLLECIFGAFAVIVKLGNYARCRWLRSVTMFLDLKDTPTFTFTRLRDEEKTQINYTSLARSSSCVF